MVFSINDLIDTMSRMTKGKFVLYSTIDVNTGFKSIKHKKVQLIYCTSSKKHEPVLTCQIADRMTTEDDIKRVDKQISKELSFSLIKYIMSDDFKKLVNE